MKIEFTKMQGCGNDYVYINGFTQKIAPDKKKDFVIRASDRHFGIGSDGVIFINPSDKADFEMEMYNADGSRSEMCGNGIRCVAKYVYDHGMTDKCDITIVSFGKVKPIHITVQDGKAALIRVDMGEPELRAINIPVKPEDAMDPADAEYEIGKMQQGADPGSYEDKSVVNAPILVAGKEYRMTCVSMGNPHAVVFVDRDGSGHCDYGQDKKDRSVSDTDIAGTHGDAEDFSIPAGTLNRAGFPDFKKEGGIENIGPLFENHKAFPNRTNAEFVRIDDRNNVHMRVWERGTGETLACGTGCCATAVACVLNGLTDRSVTVHVLGGDILVEWDKNDNHVYMTGPAVTVFDGAIDFR